MVGSDSEIEPCRFWRWVQKTCSAPYILHYCFQLSSFSVLQYRGTFAGKHSAELTVCREHAKLYVNFQLDRLLEFWLFLISPSSQQWTRFATTIFFCRLTGALVLIERTFRAAWRPNFIDTVTEKLTPDFRRWPEWEALYRKLQELCPDTTCGRHLSAMPHVVSE